MCHVHVILQIASVQSGQIDLAHYGLADIKENLDLSNEVNYIILVYATWTEKYYFLQLKLNTVKLNQ